MNEIADKIRMHYMKEDKAYKKRKREEFEDIYNPMKVYAYLRQGLGLGQLEAREMAEHYKNTFYDLALKKANHNDRTT